MSEAPNYIEIPGRRFRETKKAIAFQHLGRLCWFPWSIVRCDECEDHGIDYYCPEWFIKANRLWKFFENSSGEVFTG